MVFVVFSPGHLANTSAGGTGYVGVGSQTACLCVSDGCRDACRPMFSSEIFSAGFLGDSVPCRDLCCDACCDGRMLRPVEALPLSERLGHTLGMPGVCCDDGCDELRLVEALPLYERRGHTVLGVLEGFRCVYLQDVRGCFAGVGKAREHSAPYDVRGCFTGLGHAEFGGGRGRGAAYSLPL